MKRGKKNCDPKASEKKKKKKLYMLGKFFTKAKLKAVYAS